MLPFQSPMREFAAGGHGSCSGMRGPVNCAGIFWRRTPWRRTRPSDGPGSVGMYGLHSALWNAPRLAIWLPVVASGVSLVLVLDVLGTLELEG